MAAYLTNGGGEYTDNHAPYTPDTQSTRIQTEVKVESCFLILCRQQTQSRYGDGGHSHYWSDDPPSHRSDCLPEDVAEQVIGGHSNYLKKLLVQVRLDRICRQAPVNAGKAFQEIRITRHSIVTSFSSLNI